MNVLIVEDETAAAENLICMLREVEPAAVVVANTESVEQTVEWLRAGHSVDLIFMDIHLSDGSAFAIFEEMEVWQPVVFTTAYDRYALEAFRVNSIDYLLKPIKPEDLRRALGKFGQRAGGELAAYLAAVNALAPQPHYRSRLLVPVRDKLIPVSVKDISCVYSTNKQTEILLNDGSCLPVGKSLDAMMASLNPEEFTRANKQFVIARAAVRDLTVWFDSRLRIGLNVVTPEPVYVSKNRVAEFKDWLTS